MSGAGFKQKPADYQSVRITDGDSFDAAERIATTEDRTILEALELLLAEQRITNAYLSIMTDTIITAEEIT